MKARERTQTQQMHFFQVSQNASYCLQIIFLSSALRVSIDWISERATFSFYALPIYSLESRFSFTTTKFNCFQCRRIQYNESILTILKYRTFNTIIMRALPRALNFGMLSSNVIFTRVSTQARTHIQKFQARNLIFRKLFHSS